jgi:hypothetical protein
VGAPQRVSLLPTPISAGFVCSSLQAISAALSSECSTRYTAEMEKHTGHERRIDSTGMPFLCRKPPQLPASGAHTAVQCTLLVTHTDGHGCGPSKYLPCVTTYRAAGGKLVQISTVRARR